MLVYGVLFQPVLLLFSVIQGSMPGHFVMSTVPVSYELIPVDILHTFPEPPCNAAKKLHSQAT